MTYTWTREHACPGCGAAVMVRLDTGTGVVAVIDNDPLTRMGTHDCPAQRYEVKPIDWHSCRLCSRPVFEFGGELFDDSDGSQPHTCQEPIPQIALPPQVEVAATHPTPSPTGLATTQQWQEIRMLRAQLGITDSSDLPARLSAAEAQTFLEHLRSEVAAS